MALRKYLKKNKLINDDDNDESGISGSKSHLSKTSIAKTSYYMRDYKNRGVRFLTDNMDSFRHPGYGTRFGKQERKLAEKPKIKNENNILERDMYQKTYNSINKNINNHDQSRIPYLYKRDIEKRLEEEEVENYIQRKEFQKDKPKTLIRNYAIKEGIGGAYSKRNSEYNTDFNTAEYNKRINTTMKSTFAQNSKDKEFRSFKIDNYEKTPPSSKKYYTPSNFDGRKFVDNEHKEFMAYGKHGEYANRIMPGNRLINNNNNDNEYFNMDKNLNSENRDIVVGNRNRFSKDEKADIVDLPLNNEKNIIGIQDSRRGVLRPEKIENMKYNNAPVSLKTNHIGMKSRFLNESKNDISDGTVDKKLEIPITEISLKSRPLKISNILNNEFNYENKDDNNNNNNKLGIEIKKRNVAWNDQNEFNGNYERMGSTIKNIKSKKREIDLFAGKGANLEIPNQNISKYSFVKEGLERNTI